MYIGERREKGEGVGRRGARVPIGFIVWIDDKARGGQMGVSGFSFFWPLPRPTMETG